MSFLGDIVSSIGGDKAPAPPKPPGRPLSANTNRPVANTNKPVPRIGIPINPPPVNGVKRKAEDAHSSNAEKAVRPNPAPGLTSSVNRRPPAPPLNAPKSPLEKPQSEKPATAPKIVSEKAAQRVLPPPPKNVQPSPNINTSRPAGPAHSKGSYAEIMARAKQASEQRIPGQVGVIKHQTTVKEKHSKLAERKREEQERAKSEKQRSQVKASDRSEKRRSVSPVKKDKAVESKGSRRPLNAPTSRYQGTMGTSSSRSAQKRMEAKKRRKYDEYLGTDEEDDSDAIDDDDEEDYGSDVSSDMEARFDDIDVEEEKAAREARTDDAREKALEEKLKREKEERRKKLESLTAKRR